MLEVEIGGVAEALANLTERGAVDPVVKATLTLSESGFVAVKDAVAFGEIKDESLTGKDSLCTIFSSYQVLTATCQAN
jgi:hypoxia up-regulated 1